MSLQTIITMGQFNHGVCSHILSRIVTVFKLKAAKHIYCDIHVRIDFLPFRFDTTKFFDIVD